jgi:DNA invertase Pin-like site-specific DNA recombinase
MTHTSPTGRLIGYARVSTEDQATDAQVDALRAAGCVEIFREHVSGAKTSRPELAKALARVRRGDVLVVARLDRLARSLSHLLSVVDELDAKGAGFKSLADPIDTTTPQGRFALQVLGAVAELERALIRERTKDGLRAARRRGRVGGNPKLRAGDRDAIRRITDAKTRAYFDRLNRTAEIWLPIVENMRPAHRWQDVVRVLNANHDRPNGPPLPSWTVEKLQRAVKRFVAEGLADPALLQPAGRKVSSERLVTLVAGVRRANPEMTLPEIGAQLEAMYERTPRGGTRWSPSSVKSLLDRAEKLGLLGAETG